MDAFAGDEAASAIRNRVSRVDEVNGGVANGALSSGPGDDTSNRGVRGWRGGGA